MEKLKLLCAALFVVFSLPAQAAVNCSFGIQALWITPEGWVNVAFSGSGFGKGWWLCSTAGSTSVNDGYSQKTITSDACKSIYSMLLTAKSAGRPVRLQFEGPSACTNAALPADGSQPSPFPANFGIME